MKLLIRFSTMLFIVLSMISCGKDDDDDNTDTYKATLNGTSEVPSNSSPATGTATLTLNTTTNVFTLVVTHNLEGITAGHIHKGAVGVSGGVVFPFLTIASPINFTSVALDATQESDLNAGLYYVNLHTVAYPGGEIRGQLIKQ
ncbi:MAG: CHRD domain-containing protein [Saprospiraceae bacterium]|nr:CHRD domain-containing protein [Saprospiraceae bacterium]